MSCLPSIGGGSTGYSHLYLHSEEAVSMTLAHSKALLSRLSGQLIGQRFAKLGASARRVLLQCSVRYPRFWRRLERSTRVDRGSASTSQPRDGSRARSNLVLRGRL